MRSGCQQQTVETLWLSVCVCLSVSVCLSVCPTEAQKHSIQLQQINPKFQTNAQDNVSCLILLRSPKQKMELQES